MRLVIVESPYAGTPEQIERNVRYARAAVADCLRRGEAPFASHLLYTQPGVLRDEVPAERTHGIEAGLAIAARADLTAVYVDLGCSSGMQWGIRHAVQHEREIELRQLSLEALDAAIGPSEVTLLVRGSVRSAAISDATRVIGEMRAAKAGWSAT